MSCAVALAKGRIEQSNTRGKRKGLCEEADRLINFHARLAEVTALSPWVQSTLVPIVDEPVNVPDELLRAAPTISACWIASSSSATTVGESRTSFMDEHVGHSMR
jgi:hypothetical protein